MDRLNELRRQIEVYERVVVGFDGSASSLFLARVADQTLGHQNALVIANDASLLASAGTALNCHVVSDAGRSLFEVVAPIAAGRNAVVVLAFTLDDLDERRDDQLRAAEHGGQFPLVRAGYTAALVAADLPRLKTYA